MLPRGYNQKLFPSKYKIYFLSLLYLLAVGQTSLTPPAAGRSTAQQMPRLMRHQFRISFNIKPTVSSTTICFGEKEIVLISDGEIFMCFIELTCFLIFFQQSPSRRQAPFQGVISSLNCLLLTIYILTIYCLG